MALIPIDELIRPWSLEETTEVGLATLEALGVPARLWRPRGVGRSILGGVAKTASMATVIISDGIRGNFVEYATGKWLDLLAWNVYKVLRTPSVTASGRVTLTNAGGGSYTRAADTVIVRCTRTQRSYRVSEAFTLPPASQIEVNVVALESGAASTAGPGEINDFVTPLARVTVSNELAIVGADAEGDESLRAACLASIGLESINGPRDAYLYATLKAKLPGDVPVSINRCTVLPSNGTTLVRVVCATPTGAPSAPELLAAREEIERRARTDTDTVEISAAVVVPLTRKIILWTRGGDRAAIRAAALSSVLELVKRHPIGGIAKVPAGQGYLYADAILSAATSVSPTVFDGDFDGAGGDIPLAYNEVAALTSDIEVRAA